MDSDAFVYYLLVYGVPVVAVGAGVIAARRWGGRWRLTAVGLALGALLVIVGASVWYGSGCSDSDTCERSIGVGLEVVWFAILALLLWIVGLAVMRSGTTNRGRS